MSRILVILSNNTYESDSKEIGNRVLNESDVNVIFEALSIYKKSDNKENVVDTLCLHYDKNYAFSALRESLSYGVNDAYFCKVERRDFTNYKSLAYISYNILRNYLKSYDLYLVSRIDQDGDSSFFAIDLSKYLGLECLCYTESFFLEGNKIKARRMIDNENGINIETSLPLLIQSINESAEQIYPDVASILRAYDEDLVRVIDYDYLEIGRDLEKFNKENLLSVEKIEQTNKKIVVEIKEGDGLTCGAKIVNLLDKLGY